MLYVPVNFGCSGLQQAAGMAAAVAAMVLAVEARPWLSEQAVEGTSGSPNGV